MMLTSTMLRAVKPMSTAINIQRALFVRVTVAVVVSGVPSVLVDMMPRFLQRADGRCVTSTVSERIYYSTNTTKIQVSCRGERCGTIYLSYVRYSLYS